jgi:hypothetical protein
MGRNCAWRGPRRARDGELDKVAVVIVDRLQIADLGFGGEEEDGEGERAGR